MCIKCLFFTFYCFPANKEPIIFKRVNIPKSAVLAKLKEMTLKQCNETCYRYEGCNSFMYNEKAMFCNLSNMTQVTFILKTNKANLDTYIVRPGQ